MTSSAVLTAILAVSLTTSGLALAQAHGDRNDRDDRSRNEQAQRGGHMDRRANDGRQPDRREYRGRADSDERRADGGAGPNHQFHRGERLPAEYRNRQYVVNDWRSHNLRAPPRGYHWVQTGPDYVLVAIATGIIFQLFLHN